MNRTLSLASLAALAIGLGALALALQGGPAQPALESVGAGRSAMCDPGAPATDVGPDGLRDLLLRPVLK